MIHEASGDLLKADVEALVNTVNCVGVMGKGIALQFKRRYPAIFDEYKRACDRGEVQIGRMHVVATGELEGPRYVINFPTKKHWKARSRVEYITEGLADLVDVIEKHGIKSIALPPLGAGNGGLNWSLVEPLIRSSLSQLPHTDVYVFSPAAQPRHIEPNPDLRMTWGRAILIQLLRGYVARRQMLEPWEDPQGASHLEIQKLMYFANLVEPKLRLDFSRGPYGPYSERVRHLLQDMEGAFVRGFGDGDDPVTDLRPIVPTADGLAKLNEFSRSNDFTREQRIVDQVLSNLQGFEGPYGLELLATTHWAACQIPQPDLHSVTEAVKTWNSRKARLFTSKHVGVAFTQLTAAGLAG